MMSLSQAIVAKREAARLRLRDAYAWHQAIWQAFPGRDGEPRDFLFRLDDRGTAFRVYVLSPRAPTLPGWGEWQSKPIAPLFLDHEAYRFQLKANPTMRRCSDRRRIGIYAEDRLRDWMLRKAQQAGVQIDEDSLIVGPPTDEVFRRNGKQGKHVAADFQGLLRVIERPLFKETFTRGVGPAKAFGFGLLVIQPTT